jgi:hypothetical protein
MQAEQIVVDQVGGVTLSLTPHKMITTKTGKQIRQRIGYWIIEVNGKEVACYQDSPKRAKSARSEFNRQVAKHDAARRAQEDTEEGYEGYAEEFFRDIKG